MPRCPITYEECENLYSLHGLQLLSPKLTQLKYFPYGLTRQLELALQYSDKLSFSGIQPKLNARLDQKNETFQVVGSKGTFILKLPHAIYPELPQNEDLTMKMAALAKIEVPLHGMIYAEDQSLIYFVERFDRNKTQKISAEDFGQLAGLPSEQKYDFSMEKLIAIVDTFCTDKAAEKAKLFRQVVFNFLVGNEDAHLKNFSLIRQGDLVKLSPAYDLLNSTIVMHSKEEICLPLRGKKSHLKKSDLIEYFGKERLGLSANTVDEILLDLKKCLPSWKELLSCSFLCLEKKKAYLEILESRTLRLF